MFSLCYILKETVHFLLITLPIQNVENIQSLFRRVNLIPVII